jgi:DNA repair exonuclease SbcCD ATPase subunit
VFKRKTTDDFIDNLRIEVERLRADLCEVKRKSHKFADGARETFDALMTRVDNLASWLGKVDDIAQAAEKKNRQQDHRIKHLYARIDHLREAVGARMDRLEETVDNNAKAAGKKNEEQDQRLKLLTARIDRLLETTNSLKTAVKQTATDVVTADTIARTQEDRITAAEAEAHLAKEAAFEANTRAVNLEDAVRDCGLAPTEPSLDQRIYDVVGRVTDLELRGSALTSRVNGAGCRLDKVERRLDAHRDRFDFVIRESQDAAKTASDIAADVGDLNREVAGLKQAAKPKPVARPKPVGIAKGENRRAQSNDLIDLVIQNIRGGQVASLVYVSSWDRLRYLRDKFSNRARQKHILNVDQFSPQILMIGGGLDAVPADGNWCQVQFQVSDPDDPCPPTAPPPPPTGCRVYLDQSIFSSRIHP